MDDYPNIYLIVYWSGRNCGLPFNHDILRADVTTPNSANVTATDAKNLKSAEKVEKEDADNKKTKQNLLKIIWKFIAHSLLFASISCNKKKYCFIFSWARFWEFNFIWHLKEIQSVVLCIKDSEIFV